ncbi:MAG: plastocyanin/azurin family copper-binding protein, partial [Candidatus Thermoplasmatota archaeon]|nr:plastocyanin/azurin family copper-binding protein [Candidatus Thermoplasmatota archaeon]
RGATVLLFGLAVLAGLAGTSAANDLPETTVLAGPGAFQAGYATPAMGVLPGGELTFQNLDIIRHNVVAYGHTGSDDNPWCEEYALGACPAFWTPLIGLGATTSVQGIEQLEPGVYDFYCSAHPWMVGVLAVSPDGATISSHGHDPLAPQNPLEVP